LLKAEDARFLAAGSDRNNRTGLIVSTVFADAMAQAGAVFNERYGPWWGKEHFSLKLERNAAERLVLSVIPPTAYFVAETEVKTCRVRAINGLEVFDPTWEDLNRILSLFERPNLLDPLPQFNLDSQVG
jgi:hypothetical protein